IPFVIILGITQDGGYPHIGCQKQCCEKAWANDSLHKNVVSIALVDPKEKKWWLIEATPDIKKQLKLFSDLTNDSYNFLPDGIFITHAHIGHYTGLMEFGREAMNTKNIPVYVLPGMKKYLEENGPWSQLVTLKNITLVELKSDSIIAIGNGNTIQPFTVPHRDEFSETAGFKIITASKKYLFIPDIDKWAKFNKSIIDEVEQSDIAFLDATFYSTDELSYININEVPHPFVIETMELFKTSSIKTKNKIYFIHFNHTNPLLWDTEMQQEVNDMGYRIATQGIKI
ncbi:MAG: MBL fold metallo-hydrolase, partial [Chitinophagales bacterium]